MVYKPLPGRYNKYIMIFYTEGICLVKKMIIYLTLNLISFIIYGVDKYNAVHQGARIHEGLLLLLGFLLPIGAITGTLVFNHKVNIPAFRFAVPVFLCLHVLLYIFIA